MKLILDSAKAMLPFQDNLRRIKRKYFPYKTEPANDAWTLEQGIEQIKWLREAGFRFQDSVVMEIGTGWQPIIPLLYYLAGCSRIYLTDNKVLLDRHLIFTAVKLVKEFGPKISEQLYISQKEIAAKLSVEPFQDRDTLLSGVHMQYLAPCDIRRLNLPDASIDLVFSRAVLEHIPRTVIEDFFAECARILKKKGLMLHIVDDSDHWEHNDKSISRVNFLKFPDWLWRFTSINPLNYQNRLRHFEYLKMLENAGFRIMREQKQSDKPSAIALKNMKLPPRFQGIPHEDLAVITSYFLAAKS